jgi:hypothetical protein
LRSSGNAAANKKRSRGFTGDERAAMKERARELTVEAPPFTPVRAWWP